MILSDASLMNTPVTLPLMVKRHRYGTNTLGDILKRVKCQGVPFFFFFPLLIISELTSSITLGIKELSL